MLAFPVPQLEEPMHGLRFPAAIVAAAIASTAVAADDRCVTSGQWMRPADNEKIIAQDVIDDLVRRPIVLLGETHDRAAHHHWQLHTIAALHGRNPNIVLAFEAFPRSVQPALDRWVQGLIDRRQFLDESRWFDVWRFEPALYMPLFEFARMHRVPMLAMNADRDLVSRVGREGWAAIPAAARHGIGDPATPTTAYRAELKSVFDQHRRQARGAGTEDDPDAFERFVEAQQTWDRAMAEALAMARQGDSAKPLVVGIVGSGHLEYGHGIPHQLDDLGITDAIVLMPWETSQPCDALKTDAGPIADVVFGIATGPSKTTQWRPLLGVMIEDGDGGVGVTRVIGDSVAEAAGVKAGDVIIDAAGTPTARTADLIRIVRRQAPGTWLPVTVRRDGETVDLIGKFDPR